MARFWFNSRKNPVEPFPFFSYGMTKCGSTLAFELTRVALVQAGYEQPVVQFPHTEASKRINFIGKLNAKRAKILRETVEKLGYPIVIKTHNRPERPLVRMLQSGYARAHAVFRDPRDMALSMIDSGAQARAKGRPGFAEIETLADARNGIDNQMDSLTAWLQLPGVRRLQYDHLAFDTEKAAAGILEHLGIDGEPTKITHQVLNNEFTQQNKGLRDRYKSEMSLGDSADFTARFAPFYDLILDKTEIRDPLPPETSLKSAMDDLPTQPKST